MKIYPGMPTCQICGTPVGAGMKTCARCKNQAKKFNRIRYVNLTIDDYITISQKIIKERVKAPMFWEILNKRKNAYIFEIVGRNCSTSNKSKAQRKAAKGYSDTQLQEKICGMCGKTYRRKGGICPSCKNKLNKLNNKLQLKYPLNQSKIFYLKRIYENRGITNFWGEVFNASKQRIFDDLRYSSHSERLSVKSEIKADMRDRAEQAKSLSISLEKRNDVKNAEVIPYGIDGFIVYFNCPVCGKKICIEYDFFMKNGYICDHKNSMSSYEQAVYNYLKTKGIAFKTQYETLCCKNPKTGHTLPYDFELTEYNMIVEVHGAQHYDFCPIFHKTEDDFKEQQWRDNYKKNFALSNGYHFLELPYTDFSSSAYERKINAAIASAKSESKLIS